MQLNHSDSLIFRDNYLNKDSWIAANKVMTKKILTELTHEGIITPEHISHGDYVLNIENQCVCYHFKAKKYLLAHLDINLASIKKYKGGLEIPVDALDLFIELLEFIHIDKAILPTYVDELISTLNGWVYKCDGKRLSSDKLILADYESIESTMDEGHPAIIANRGCYGFDFIDSLVYSPECMAKQKVVWIAVHKDKATFSAISSLSYQDIIQSELSTEKINYFSEIVHQYAVLNDDYYWMPVHEWQWREKILIRFSADIAKKNIIFLGMSVDEYSAQQSIRTLFNVSHPNKHYIKLAISIFNSGFMRGLSPYAMKVAPGINEWLDDVCSQDNYLLEKNFKLLKEVAAIGFRDTLFEQVITESSPQKHMLSALWRESAYDKIEKNQRIMTMAALLHVDKNETAFIVELIKSSSLSGHEWVKAYLDCYLLPQLHLFYVHDIAFMPHGQNVILIIEENKPVGILMKDIAEEVIFFNPEGSLPEAVAQCTHIVKDNLKIEHFWTEIFDYFFRYLAVILDKHDCLAENDFWQLTADAILEYQTQHPEYKEKYVRLDLFKPTFKQYAINRQKMIHGPECLSLPEFKTNKDFTRELPNPLFLFKK
ncbi:TPA: IucA/IucC family protein [Providencia alcalifaciens]